MTITIYEMCNKLKEAAALENSELEEWWDNLANLGSRVRDSASEEFYDSWKKEIEDNYNYFEREYSIVEEEVTKTYSSKVKRLKWIYED